MHLMQETRNKANDLIYLKQGQLQNNILFLIVL